MSDPSKTYCKYFFNHVALWNGRLGNPCCRYNNKTDAHGDNLPTVYPMEPVKTFKETFNSDKWKELRRKSMAGEKENGCWKCYEEEENGITSLRQQANMMMKPDKMAVRAVMKENQYGDWAEVLDFIQQPKLTYLEMNLGNHCNLACNICSSSLSTKWEDDDKWLNDEMGFSRGVFGSDTKLQIEYSKEDYEHVNMIKFVGGEPMLHPKFSSIVDFIIETGYAKNITLQIFTNASWIPKEAIINRLTKFKKVRISLSIDGTKEVNDYTRHLSSWETVNATARRWLELSEEHEVFQIKWEPTLSVYNANHIPEMFQWWLDLCLEIRSGDTIQDALWLMEEHDLNIYLNNVMYPSYLQPKLFPHYNNGEGDKDLFKRIEIYLKDLTDKYYDEDNHINMRTLRDLKRTVRKGKALIAQDPTKKEIHDFYKYSILLDKRRGKDIKTALPEVWRLVTKEKV